MARSVATIRADINTKLAAEGLTAISNSSSTSVVGIILNVFSSVIAFYEQLLDDSRDEILKDIVAQKVHTQAYLVTLAKEFQYSEVAYQRILFDNYYKPRFEVTDPNLRIITSVSVRESSRKVSIKVNKGTPGSLQVLTDNELRSFKSYMMLVKPLGIPYVIESLPAEKMVVSADINFNSGIVSLNKATVDAVINSYLAQMNDSQKFSIQDLEAKILAISGVTDVKLNFVIVYSDNGLNNITIYRLSEGINEQTYLPFSGHMILDTSRTVYAFKSIN